MDKVYVQGHARSRPRRTEVETENKAEEVTRKKKYEPTDDDYDLTSVRIEQAENGVVVNCGYRIKESVANKMKKAEPGYYPGYCEDEKHVFEDESSAKEFIMGELNALWP